MDPCSDLALMNILLTAYNIPEEQEPLSITSRGIVKNIVGAHCVVRISRFSGSNSGSGAFASYFYKHQSSVHGLVPILSHPLALDEDYVIEKYEEILYTRDTRLDLHGYCMVSRHIPQKCRYLHDVIRTLADLHDHHWAHMDVSLENVALTQQKAYLIDFESCTDFCGGEGFFEKRDIPGPLKLPLCPPEHFLGENDDLVSLPAYDVWAFGVMLFAVLFDDFLFKTWIDPKTNTTYVDLNQVRYLCHEGFGPFLKRYHSGIYNELFQTVSGEGMLSPRNNPSQRLNYECAVLVYDLLAHIFVKNKRKRSARTRRILHSPELRLSARKIVSHPFWTVMCA